MYNLYVPVKFHIMFCMQVLIDWINDVLVGERIIVKDLAEDLYDGQVLQKLFGKVFHSLQNIPSMLAMHHIILWNLSDSSWI